MKNVTSVEVLLSGVRVGELVSVPRRGTFFAYDEQWLATGFNLSPLNMEFKSAPQAAPDLHLFGGLMGVFADSLPDGCLPFMQGGCTQLLQSPCLWGRPALSLAL